MVEDGRDYLVYIKYSLLNFPKIITRIFPFALFFSFSYVLSKYELNNELIDIENNRIELKKFPTPPKGKTIKDVNVIINIDNDNQKH